MQSSEENTAALQQAIDQRDREVTQLRQTLASKNEESHDVSTRMHQVALQDEQATPVTIDANMRWSIVSSLPVSTSHPSTTICGNVYIHSRADDVQEKYSVYKCS